MGPLACLSLFPIQFWIRSDQCSFIWSLHYYMLMACFFTCLQFSSLKSRLKNFVNIYFYHYYYLASFLQRLGRFLKQRIPHQSIDNPKDSRVSIHLFQSNLFCRKSYPTVKSLSQPILVSGANPFYSLGWCKIKCQNCQFYGKKCIPIYMFRVQYFNTMTNIIFC